MEAAINLRQLRYFVKIGDAGSFTRAAEQLNVAQPTLGMQIRQLEQELGIDLLERHSRGVVLTEAGQRLVERARRILHDVDETKREICALAPGNRRTLVLGLTPSIMLQIGPDLLLDARSEMPRISLSLVEELSFVLAGVLERGELDYAFAYEVDEKSGVERLPVLEEDLLFVTAATGVPMPGTITLAEALTYDLVMAGERDMVQRIVRSTAEKLALPMRVTYQAQSVSAMRTLVARGVAASIMPHGSAAQELLEGKLIGRRIVKAPLRRTLYLIQSSARSSFKHDEDVQRFLKRAVQRLLVSLGPLARPIEL